MTADELESWMAAAAAPEGRVEADEMLARLRRQMFDRDTVPRVGRYEGLEEIGRGGMGVVYRAYDPKLRRHVAIKVLRTDRARTRARLRQEARAMARLSHPNVVQVLEVGATVDGELFVVMEYVDGTNAAAWLREEAREPAEIFRVFGSAGEGLAAAHASGIVHRDFKPGNVLVSNDGRVLVGDFGLARDSDEPPPPPTVAEAESTNDADDTRTGTRLGTPRYMAPEQREHSRVDARADQWALAFSIREALPAAPGRAIDRVLERALARDADRRFRDLPAFLAALRAAARPRGRSPIVAAVVATGVVAGAVAFLRPSTHCEPAARLAEVWTSARRDGIGPAFAATDVSYAAHAADNTIAVLDAYVERWSGAYADACAAENEGAQVCLTAELTELDATLDAFETADAKLVGEAEKAARGLTPPRRCIDAPALTVVDVAALEAYARRLSRVEVLTRAGRWDEARDASELLVGQAAALGDSYATAEAAFRLGMNRKRTGDFDGAAAALTSAYYTAAEAELAERAARAAIGQIQVAQRRADYPATEQWARHAETWIARVPDDRDLRIELLVTLADVDTDRSHDDAALERLQAAWDLCERDPDGPQTGRILNLMATAHINRGEFDDAERLLHRVEVADNAYFGPGHPNLSHVYNNLGTVHYHRGEYDEARESWQRAYDIVVATMGEGSIQTAVLLMNLGIAADELGDVEGALEKYAEAEDVYAAKVGRDHPSVAHVVENRASTLSTAGRYDESLAALREALRIYAAFYGEDHARVGEAHFKVANVLSDLRRLDEGIEEYELAREIIGRHQGEAHPLYGVLLHNLGIALYKSGDFETAAQLHRAAMAIEQDHYGPSHLETAVTLVGVAEAELAVGNYAEAAVAAEMVLGADPDDPLRMGLATFDLAQARYELRRDLDTVPALISEARQLFAVAGRRARDNPALLQEWVDAHPLR